MSESTLLLRYGDLAEEVGFFLGYGRLSADWSDSQESAIVSVIKSGLRQFYFPPGQAYDWSFLRPIRTLVLASGANTVALPEDYGGVEGQVTLYSTSQSSWPIQWANEAVVRQRYSELPACTGRPVLISEQTLKVSPGHSPSQQFFLYPAADQAYTLQFAQYVLADALTDSAPYAYGGMAHSETIKESCLAMAELQLDDMAGPHTQKFMERLQASIQADRRHKPQKLGYNSDRSDGQDWDSRSQHVQGSITYQGVQH